jgi:hypothetical protein
MFVDIEALKGRYPSVTRACIAPSGLYVVGPKIPGRCPGLSNLSPLGSTALRTSAGLHGLDEVGAGFSESLNPLIRVIPLSGVSG